MAKTIKTFPIIQCFPPSGKLAKSSKPLSIGEEAAQKHSDFGQGSHWLGPCWGQQGEHFYPTSHWPGREETIPELANNLHAHGCPRTRTHPRTNPWLQTSQLQACRAGEGGGQGPHSGWQGKPSQDHTEQKSCPGTHRYFNWKWTHWTLPGSRALNHYKPSLKENFLTSFSLLCLHYSGTNKRAGCDDDAVTIRPDQVHRSRPFF